jgi:hypothetical protein
VLATQVSPDPIFQMVTGYWVSKTLMTAVELEVFTKLSGNKTVNIKEFQNMFGMQQRPAEVFSTALVSLGLLNVNNMTKNKEGKGERDNLVYSNSQVSDVFLDKNKPSYIGDFIIMMDKHLYNRWGKLAVSLKTNKPVDETEGQRSGQDMYDQAKINRGIEQIQMFTRSMYGISVGPAMALPKIFDFSDHKKMIDIGGGSGIYSIQVVKANLNMSALILDLEPVCKVADEYIKQFKLQDKIQTQVADFLSKEDFPKGCDVALLSHIIHFQSEEKVKVLLRKVYDCLSDDEISGNGGVVLISEWLLNDEKTGPIPSALMSLTMIVDQPEGRNYSFSEVSKMLVDVGFTDIEKRPLAGPAEIVIGYKNRR